jgi:hypothetical protein
VISLIVYGLDILSDKNQLHTSATKTEYSFGTEEKIISFLNP